MMFYVNLYGLPKISNVHLLYSFIHVFIYNSITKCFWQNFAKPLAKAFRKTSIILLQNDFVDFTNSIWFYII